MTFPANMEFVEVSPHLHMHTQKRSKAEKNLRDTKLLALVSSAARSIYIYILSKFFFIDTREAVRERLHNLHTSTSTTVIS